MTVLYLPGGNKKGKFDSPSENRRLKPLRFWLESDLKRTYTVFCVEVTDRGRLLPHTRARRGEDEVGPSWIYRKKHRQFGTFDLCVDADIRCKLHVTDVWNSQPRSQSCSPCAIQYQGQRNWGRRGGLDLRWWPRNSPRCADSCWDMQGNESPLSEPRLDHHILWGERIRRFSKNHTEWHNNNFG